MREITIRAEDVFLALILLIWFIRTAITKDITKVFKTKLTTPFFQYLVVCILATVFGIVWEEKGSVGVDARFAFFSIFKYLEYFLLFLMVKYNARSLRQIKIFIALFILAAILLSVYSNRVIDEQIEAGETYFRVGPPVTGQGKRGEPGSLGGYLIFMMAIVGGFIIYYPSTLLRVFFICSEILMFRVFLYTLARGSYLALVPMVLSLVFFSKKILWLFVLLAVFLVCVPFLPSMIESRIKSTVTEKYSAEGKYIELEESPRFRLESWKVVFFDRFVHSPLFGYGIGRYFVDSQVFSTLCDIGLVGFLLLGRLLFKLFKMVKETLNLEIVRNSQFGQAVCVGFLAGFMGLVVNSISTNIFIIIRIMEAFWFMAAIVLSLPDIAEGSSKYTTQKQYPALTHINS